MTDPERVPRIGRLLDRLPDDAWEESPHRRPYPRSDDPSTRPVVLVHGAAGSRSNFTGVVPALRAAGHPVLSVSYGHHGTTGLRTSFTRVRALLTGIVADAGRVDLVGHSQGGLIALAASGTPDLRGKVGRVVGIAGSFRGVCRPRFLPARLPLPVPAWSDNLVGSPALAAVLDYTRRSTVPVVQVLSTADRIVPVDRARAFLSDDPVSGVPAHRGPVRVLTVTGTAHENLPYSREVGELVAGVLG